MAAQQQLGALVEGILHVLGDLLDGVAIDQRADLDALFQAIAHGQLSVHGGGQLLAEGIDHAGLHQEAIGTDAGLAGIAELGCHRAFHRRIEIGVFEHQEGRVAAKLQRDLLDMLRGICHQATPDFRGAGEGHLAHDAGIGHRLGDVLGRARHDIEDAAWHASAFRQHRQRQRRERRLAGRLDHDRAARGQRGARLAGNHRGREVPRRDRPHHSDRLLEHQNTLVTLGGRNGIAIHALTFFREPAQEAGRVLDFTGGFGEGLALLQRHDLRQIILVLQHQGVPLHQDVSALQRRRLLPVREGVLRRLDGTFGLGVTQPRHAADDLAGGRIVNLDLLAGIRGYPATVDIGKWTKQTGIVEMFHEDSRGVLVGQGSDSRLPETTQD